MSWVVCPVFFNYSKFLTLKKLIFGAQKSFYSSKIEKYLNRIFVSIWRVHTPFLYLLFLKKRKFRVGVSEAYKNGLNKFLKMLIWSTKDKNKIIFEKTFELEPLNKEVHAIRMEM